MKKVFKKIIQKALNQLPEFVKHYVFRRMIKLPLEIKSGTVFKVAESMSELESAFSLVYQAYVKLGYCSENESKMRGTYYHALPSTVTLIAKNQSETVGTLSIVRDNTVFQLPLESKFDLMPLRQGGHRIAEITSMVVHPAHRRSLGGNILFPLMKLMYHYCSDSFGVSRLVIAVSPKDEDFYKALFLFKRVPRSEVKDYLGAPAVAMYLDLDVAANELFEIYKNMNSEKNLYSYFKEWQSPAIQIESKQYFEIENTLVNAKLYSDLFVKKLKMQHPKLDQFFVASASNSFDVRGVERIKIDAPSIFRIENSPTLYSVQVKNFSISGFQTKYLDQVQAGDKIEFSIYLKSSHPISVSAVLVWKDQLHGCGWKIVSASQEWNEMYEQYLNHKQPQQPVQI